MLTNWVRDCGKGDRYHLPVAFVVKKQSHDTARLFGMSDRGTLEPGMKAHLNVINLNALRIKTRTMIDDSPAEMPHLRQTAQGYVVTIATVAEWLYLLRKPARPKSILTLSTASHSC